MSAVCRLLRCYLFVLAFAPLSADAGAALVYVTNSAGDSIHVIDTATNKVKTWVPLPAQGYGTAPTPDGRFLVPPDAPFHDPLLALAYVAALTTKIRLATGIFVVPLRNAFATAKAIATLDQLSQGRVIFGVGIGWLREEFEAVGMKFEDRALRTREYLELMI